MEGDLSISNLVLFGAFDRHNFGDLLFPHIVGAMLGGRPFLTAGVARRDMRPFGGHDVLAVADVAIVAGNSRVDVLHVGGELLTCDAWGAAVMTSTEVEANFLANLRSLNRKEQLTWAHSHLHLQGNAPYCVPKNLFANPGRFLYNAVGGVELSRRSPAFREEVAKDLHAADCVSVRDHVTHSLLHKKGVAATMTPDPAVMVTELFGDRIFLHGETGEPARVRNIFASGYVAVQISADFGDDASLDTLAAQLAMLPHELGIVFFRAGAAPWHDDTEVYRRLANRLGSRKNRLFESLDIWDICALLAFARLYCGSSLHGRIVAHACGVPGVSLVQAASGQPSKLAAYMDTWHAEEAGSVVAPIGLGAACTAALEHSTSLDHARQLAAGYREHFSSMIAGRLTQA